MKYSVHQIRGYAAQFASALLRSRDGAYARLDIKTVEIAREILLEYARSLGVKTPVGPKLYILLWDLNHPLLWPVSKSLDPYLAVDLTDAMEMVKKTLPDTGVRETIAEGPRPDGEVQFLAKGRVLARAIPWQEVK